MKRSKIEKNLFSDIYAKWLNDATRIRMITVVEVVTVVVEEAKALLETTPRITRGGPAVMEKQRLWNHKK